MKTFSWGHQCILAFGTVPSLDGYMGSGHWKWTLVYTVPSTGLGSFAAINGEGQRGLSVLQAMGLPKSQTQLGNWMTTANDDHKNLKKERGWAENRVWCWRRLPPQTSLSVPMEFPDSASSERKYLATVFKSSLCFLTLLARVSGEFVKKDAESVAVHLRKVVSWSAKYCCNKISHTLGGLQTAEIDFSQCRRLGSSRSRCRHGLALVGSSSGS